MTIYEALKKSGIKFSKYDACRIGEEVQKVATATGKVEQVETYGKKQVKMNVKNYAEKDTEKIYAAIIAYFSKDKKEPEPPVAQPKKRKRILVKKRN